ncbi:universal stress protein [Alicyclobacillus acidoterrestris]|uniref:universal stress protein n=1 Tax=Alicyclobacillus acidoterrestris TaxID=1450 RepID=UPI003F5313CB
MNKIVWATDGSTCATAAGKTVMKLLDVFPESTVTALYVIHPQYVGTGMGIVPEVADAGFEAVAKGLAQAIDEQFEAYQGRVQFVSEYGSPAIVICEFAAKEDADLIVLGSHGYGVVDRLLLGSVSSGVVHRSPISTLVVKERG